MIDPKIKNIHYELTLELPGKQVQGHALCRQVLINFGIKPNEIIEETSSDGVRTCLYLDSLQKCQLLKHKLKDAQLRGVKLSSRVCHKNDWLEAWKADWHPFQLTKKIDVVPVWKKSEYLPGKRKFIWLDTAMSFGTGLHETTQMMAQLIENHEGEFKTFFDIGTGTGILSLVALCSGADEVCAVDISPLSIRTARDNMKANFLKFNWIKRADIGALKFNQKFDFVAANLVTEDLIALRRKIVQFVRTGGWLAVSGVSLGNLRRLRQSYTGWPLRCVNVCKGKDWAAVLFQKKFRGHMT